MNSDPNRILSDLASFLVGNEFIQIETFAGRRKRDSTFSDEKLKTETRPAHNKGK